MRRGFSLPTSAPKAIASVLHFPVQCDPDGRWTVFCFFLSGEEDCFLPTSVAPLTRACLRRAHAHTMAVALGAAFSGRASTFAPWPGDLRLRLLGCCCRCCNGCCC
jgi:hypothetical protein